MSHEATTTHHTTAHFDWKGWLAKQGLIAVMLAAFSYFLAFYIVVPMRDDQREFMRSVVKQNEQNSLTNHTNASTLAGILETQKQLLAVQQDIRDDQRSGAWRETKTAQKP